MKEKRTFYIRIVVTIILIYGVYTETGIWTAIFAANVCIAAEMSGVILKSIQERIKALERYRRLP